MTEERAHKATEKRLAKIEQRLAGIYDRAEQELEAKADKYFSQFAEADEKKLKLVEQGKLDEEQYTAWRKRQMLTGERYTRLKEQIAAEYVNINQTALSLPHISDIPTPTCVASRECPQASWNITPPKPFSIATVICPAGQ